MRIGYMFWGFLGPGTAASTDVGRGWRKPLIEVLGARGHQVVFLQMDRDLVETGIDLAAPPRGPGGPGGYRWDVGRPDLDALILEWRWPVPGRNTSLCGRPGHACDLHRQDALLAAYTDQGTPTVIWDLHRRLPADDPLRRRANVVVCEPSPAPSPGAVTLFPPVCDADLGSADPSALAAGDRDLHLVFVGDRHADRDPAFARFFAPAAKDHSHLVAGAWPSTDPWPWIRTSARIGRGAALALHHRALATILLTSGPQARAGHVTHRLPEAVLSGCLPITPVRPGQPSPPTPSALHVSSGAQASDLLIGVDKAGIGYRAELLAECLDRIEPLRLSRQAAVLEGLLSG